MQVNRKQVNLLTTATDENYGKSNVHRRGRTNLMKIYKFGKHFFSISVHLIYGSFFQFSYNQAKNERAGPNVIKLFTSVSYKCSCLSLSLPSLVCEHLRGLWSHPQTLDHAISLGLI